RIAIELERAIAAEMNAASRDQHHGAVPQGFLKRCPRNRSSCEPLELGKSNRFACQVSEDRTQSSVVDKAGPVFPEPSYAGAHRAARSRFFRCSVHDFYTRQTPCRRWIQLNSR